MRRIGLGKRQEDVAADGGADDDGKEFLTQPNVADIETGRTHLLGVGLGKAVALAKGLDWTLADLQKATGIDLGFGAFTKVAQGTANVYPLQAALNPEQPGLPVDHEAVAPGIAQPLLLRADTDEMQGGAAASIRAGSTLHLDLTQTQPTEGRVYVVTDHDGVHVRVYTGTRLGAVFRAVKSDQYEDIPAKEARVVGLVVHVAADYAPESTLN